MKIFFIYSAESNQKIRVNFSYECPFKLSILLRNEIIVYTLGVQVSAPHDGSWNSLPSESAFANMCCLYCCDKHVLWNPQESNVNKSHKTVNILLLRCKTQVVRSQMNANKSHKTMNILLLRCKTQVVRSRRRVACLHYHLYGYKMKHIEFEYN